jgi:hypothetical protein
MMLKTAAKETRRIFQNFIQHTICPLLALETLHRGKMDYAEEQSQELEALESIYYDSFELISRDHPAVSFRVHIRPEDFNEAVKALERARKAVDSDDEGDNVGEAPVNYFLKVDLPETYPEVLPEMDIEEASEGLDEEDQAALLEALKTVAEENMGMPMIFAVASSAKDGLEDLIKARKDEAERERVERIEREEEAERKRREGTKVTPESFAAWKKAFEKEMQAAGRTDLVWISAAAKVVKGRVTGRQLFEQDKGLALSDSQYMDAGDVTVDTELFDEEDLGDLAIDSDEDEEDNDVLLNLSEDD